MNVENPLWIVGRVVDASGRFEFQGVFSEQVLAIQACRDETYFMGPADLNVQLPHEASEWPGACYPKAATI